MQVLRQLSDGGGVPVGGGTGTSYGVRRHHHQDDDDDDDNDEVEVDSKF